MTRWMLTAVALAASGLALAKLPPPDEAAKAKAAETAARSAWQAKVAAFQLCQAQNRVVAMYKRTAANKSATMTTAAAAPMAGNAGTPAAGATSASAPTLATPPAAATMPTPTPATASQGGGTPVAAAAPVMAPPPPCADPGPFAYTPPSQKPLEAAGAHSPTGTATSPPNVRTPSAEMTDGKTGAAPAPGAK